MINTEPLSGFRDSGQRETASRQWLVNAVKKIFDSFGYWSIETPAIERAEVLNGQYGEEGDKLQYHFKDNGDREVGLRYDLTVPFARYVARAVSTGEIRLPFRRSQIQPVYRAESPQAGRFREFYQCDYDIAGSTSPQSDAEVILAAEAIGRMLRLNYQIRISSRPLLEAILRLANLPENIWPKVMGLLDRREKIGDDELKKALIAAGLTKNSTEKLLGAVSGGLEGLEKEALDEAGVSALNDLNKIITLVGASASEKKRIVVDLTIIRGLSYYTGLVFEVIDLDERAIGSFIGGGRYDNTIGTFLGRKVPAVGASLGLERTLTILEKKKLLPETKALVDVAVLPMEKQVELGLTVASRLRKEGISTVLCLDGGSVGEMLGFASKTSRFALILGANEAKTDKLSLKDLSSKKQYELSFEELVSHIKPND